jgi:chromosome segregation ATPase
MSLGRPTSAPHPNRAPLDKGLAENVLELRSTLTKYTQELDERAAEKKRLLAIQADFRRHLAWQKQRKQTLQRNHERLFNERTWLDGKSAEVGQDVTLLSNELRQCKTEVDKLKAERDAQAETLLIAREEAKLEISSLGSMQELCTQATKALSVHTVRAGRARARRRDTRTAPHGPAAPRRRRVPAH